jgi:hypothetical protein
MVEVLSMHLWIWNIETCQSHFKKVNMESENNGEDELTWGTIYVYVETSQWIPSITILF